jgi:hypothetical protein
MRVLEYCVLESEKGTLALNNSPWCEPIYSDQLNVCPLAGLEEIGFLNKKR